MRIRSLLVGLAAFVGVLPASALAGHGGNVHYYSDLPYYVNYNGWGEVQSDRSIEGNPLRIGGKEYAKGIGSHANSNVGVDITGLCPEGDTVLFKAELGIDDEVDSHYTDGAVFQIWRNRPAEGFYEKALETPVLGNKDAPYSVEVDVTGFNDVGIVTDMQADNYSDHTDAGDARFECVGGEEPPPPAPPDKAQCEDGQDNDGDDRTDYPSDPGCTSVSDNDETDPAEPPPLPPPSGTRGQDCPSYSLMNPSLGGQEIVVSPGQSIDAAADGAFAGDVVTVESGTYNEHVTPENSGVVIQARDCGQAFVVGGFSPPGGFREDNGDQTPSDVRVRGFDISEGFPSGGSDYTGIMAIDGWKADHVRIHQIAGSGIAWHVRGDNTQIISAELDHNGRHGIVGAGNPFLGYTDYLENALIQNVLHHNNNIGCYEIGESGSTKILHSRNVIWDNVHSFSNNGPGIWFDGDNAGFVIRNSLFQDSSAARCEQQSGVGGIGILLELQSAPNGGPDGLVENNVIENNESAGIEVAESHNVVIRNNRIQNNWAAIAFRWANDPGGRTDPTHDRPHNVTAYENEFLDWFGDFAVGIIFNPQGGMGDPTALGHSFDRNTYRGGRNFSWEGHQYDTVQEMCANLGYECGGQDI